MSAAPLGQETQQQLSTVFAAQPAQLSKAVRPTQSLFAQRHFLSSSSADYMEAEPTPDLIIDANFMASGLHGMSGDASMGQHTSSGDYFVPHEATSDGDSPWPNTPYQYSTFPASSKPRFDAGIMPHDTGLYYPPVTLLPQTSSDSALDLSHNAGMAGLQQSSLDNLSMPYSLSFQSPPLTTPTNISTASRPSPYTPAPKSLRTRSFASPRPTQTQLFAQPRHPSDTSTASTSASPLQSPDTPSTSRSPPINASSLNKGSGRRPKVPHTQAERRYRENLNAHLDELRRLLARVRAQRGAFRQRQQQRHLTSPDGLSTDGATALSSGSPPGVAESDSTGAGTMQEHLATELNTWKPSKAEVIANAIEYIQTLETQNRMLWAEVQGYRGV